MSRSAASIASALSVCLLAVAGHAPAQAQLQGLSSGDVNEWTSFAPRAPAPQRLKERTDLTFKAIAHDGPFSPEREAAWGASERQLLALLQQARWADALSYLKAEQPDLNRRDGTGLSSATPLSLAAQAGQLELVREMLRQGADPEQIGAGGMTPLGAAAFLGHDLVLQDLLRAGARVDQPVASGQQPLHLACATGHVQAMALLMRQGADWRAPNREGRTALEEAAYFGQVPALEALQQAGAKLSEPDAYGLNAVHAAALGEQPQALAWLRARGVRVPSVLSQVLVDRLGTSALAPEHP